MMLTHENFVGHQAMLVGSQVTPLRCRNQDPAIENEGKKDDSLSPVWSQEHVSSITEIGKIGPLNA